MTEVHRATLEPNHLGWKPSSMLPVVVTLGELLQSLCLSFLIYKMDIITDSYYLGCWKVK